MLELTKEQNDIINQLGVDQRNALFALLDVNKFPNATMDSINKLFMIFCAQNHNEFANHLFSEIIENINKLFTMGKWEKLYTIFEHLLKHRIEDCIKMKKEIEPYEEIYLDLVKYIKIFRDAGLINQLAILRMAREKGLLSE